MRAITRCFFLLGLLSWPIIPALTDEAVVVETNKTENDGEAAKPTPPVPLPIPAPATETPAESVPTKAVPTQTPAILPGRRNGQPRSLVPGAGATPVTPPPAVVANPAPAARGTTVGVIDFQGT